MEVELNTTLGDQPLKIQTGKLAKQASGAVVVQYGETVVLVTAVGSTDERDMGFLPLTVEYMEKIYAAGRIPGNYFRREIGRPSEKETLTARLIDRPIRPLFPKGYRFEIQIIATVLSMDQENFGHPFCRPHRQCSGGTDRWSTRGQSTHFKMGPV